MTSAPAIGFDYRPSCWMTVALASIGGATAVAVLMSGAPAWARIATVAVVLACVWRAELVWTRGRVWQVGCDAAGQWQLHLRDEGETAAVLAGFRVLGPCILLRFKLAVHGELALLLTPDNSDADLRRRLRMRLAALDLSAALPRI